MIVYERMGAVSAGGILSQVIKDPPRTSVAAAAKTAAKTAAVVAKQQVVNPATWAKTPAADAGLYVPVTTGARPAASSAPTSASTAATAPRKPAGGGWQPSGPTGVGGGGAPAPSVPNAAVKPAVIIPPAAPVFAPEPSQDAYAGAEPIPFYEAEIIEDEPIATAGASARVRDLPTGSGSVSVSASIPDGAVYALLGLAVVAIGGGIAWHLHKKKGRR